MNDGIKGMLRSKFNEISNLPYKDRLESANNVYNALLSLGYSDDSAKKFMRAEGFAHGLIIRLHNHAHSLC